MGISTRQGSRYALAPVLAWVLLSLAWICPAQFEQRGVIFPINGIYEGSTCWIKPDPAGELHFSDTALGTSTTLSQLLSGTSTTLAADSVKDTHIDWGTGAGQVSTTDLPEGSNLYFTNTRARQALGESITGISFNSISGLFTLDTGYVIPTTTTLGGISATVSTVNAGKTSWDAAATATTAATAGAFWAAPITASFSKIVKRDTDGSVGGLRAIHLNGDDIVLNINGDSPNIRIAHRNGYQSDLDVSGGIYNWRYVDPADGQTKCSLRWFGADAGNNQAPGGFVTAGQIAICSNSGWTGPGDIKPYSVFGDGVSNHTSALNQKYDLLLSGDFEVNGVSYFDGNVYLNAVHAVNGANITFEGDVVLDHTVLNIDGNPSVGNPLLDLTGYTGATTSYTIQTDNDANVFGTKTCKGWLRIKVNGVTSWIPYFQ